VGDVAAPDYASGRPTTPLLLVTGILAALFAPIRLRGSGRAFLGALAGFPLVAAVSLVIGAIDGVASGRTLPRAADVVGG